MVADWWRVKGVKEKELEVQLKKLHAAKQAKQFAHVNRFQVKQKVQDGQTIITLTRNV